MLLTVYDLDLLITKLVQESQESGEPKPVGHIVVAAYIFKDCPDRVRHLNIFTVQNFAINLADPDFPSETELHFYKDFHVESWDYNTINEVAIQLQKCSYDFYMKRCAEIFTFPKEE